MMQHFAARKRHGSNGMEIFEEILSQIEEEEERQDPKLKRRRERERKFGRDINKLNLHAMAEKCADGEMVAALPPLDFTPRQPADDTYKDIYQLASEFLTCADDPTGEMESMHLDNIGEMYSKVASGEWRPALGSSATKKILNLKLDLSPFMTKDQASERIAAFQVQAIALLEAVQARFVFGQRFVCAAGWFSDLKYKDGRKVELSRFSKLLTVAKAVKTTGPNPKLESVALEMGWGTKYPPSKLAELSRDMTDAKELVRRAALGIFPFNECGELTLPSAEKKKSERAKTTKKSRR